MEALTWLQQEEGRAVGDSSECLTPEASIKLVQDLYAAGAVQVTVHLDNYSDEYLDEEDSADSLTVVLPEDENKRKALFNIQKRVYEDEECGNSFDPETDSGQKSFTIGWD